MVREGDDTPQECGQRRRREGGQRLAEDSKGEKEDEGTGKEELISCHRKGPTNKWAGLEEGDKGRGNVWYQTKHNNLARSTDNT